MSVKQKQISNLLSSHAVHTAILHPTGSKVFMKRLIPAAIATILHRRTNFDATTYKTHQFKGIEYSTFSSKNNSSVKEIRCWIEGALDAFEKNYLRELYLLFTKTDASTDVIESYKFEFSYFSDYEKSTVQCDDLDESTSSLLVSINALKMYELLHTDQFSVGFILTYNEDVTPKEYKSPFYNADRVTISSILNKISNGGFFHLGHICTGFHSMRCLNKESLLTPTDSEANLDLDLDLAEELDRIYHITDKQVGEVDQTKESLSINDTSSSNTIISISSEYEDSRPSVSFFY